MSNEIAKTLIKVRICPELFADMEQTPENCLSALHYNPLVIEHIRYPTSEMYEKAIDSNPTTIRFVPKELLTDKLIKKAVSELGSTIRHIDDPTDEIYAAVEPVTGLPYLPDEFKTEKKCIKYIVYRGIIRYEYDSGDQTIYWDEYDIKHVPEHFHTHDFFMKIAKKGELERIPIAYRTEEIIYEAVKAMSANLEHVEDQSEDLCWLAIKLDLKSIYYVKNQTEEMKWYVIKNASKYNNPLDNIVNPTDEMIIECLKVNPKNISHVKNPSTELIKLALEKVPKILSYYKNQTEEICWFALHLSPDAITRIKEPTKEMYEYAFTKSNDLRSLLIKYPLYRLSKLRNKDKQGYLDICELLSNVV